MKEKRAKEVSRVKNDVCEIASLYDKCTGGRWLESSCRLVVIEGNGIKKAR
jgi:hypothetical protein